MNAALRELERCPWPSAGHWIYRHEGKWARAWRRSSYAFKVFGDFPLLASIASSSQQTFRPWDPVKSWWWDSPDFFPFLLFGWGRLCLAQWILRLGSHIGLGVASRAVPCLFSLSSSTLKLSSLGSSLNYFFFFALTMFFFFFFLGQYRGLDRFWFRVVYCLELCLAKDTFSVKLASMRLVLLWQPAKHLEYALPNTK